MNKDMFTEKRKAWLGELSKKFSPSLKRKNVLSLEEERARIREAINQDYHARVWARILK